MCLFFTHFPQTIAYKKKLADIELAEKNVEKFGRDTPVKSNPHAKSGTCKRLTYGAVLDQAMARDVEQWSVASLVSTLAQINLWNDEMATRGQRFSLC